MDQKPHSEQPLFIQKNSQNCTFSDFSACTVLFAAVARTAMI